MSDLWERTRGAQVVCKAKVDSAGRMTGTDCDLLRDTRDGEVGIAIEVINRTNGDRTAAQREEIARLAQVCGRWIATALGVRTDAVFSPRMVVAVDRKQGTEYGVVVAVIEAGVLVVDILGDVRRGGSTMTRVSVPLDRYEVRVLPEFTGLDGLMAYLTLERGDIPAVDAITNPETLIGIARSPRASVSIRNRALARITDTYVLRDALVATTGAVHKEIADRLSTVLGPMGVATLVEPAVLLAIAMYGADGGLCSAAVAQITDADHLRTIAVKAPMLSAAVAAAERIDDPDMLLALVGADEACAEVREVAAVRWARCMERHGFPETLDRQQTAALFAYLPSDEDAVRARLLGMATDAARRAVLCTVEDDEVRQRILATITDTDTLVAIAREEDEEIGRLAVDRIDDQRALLSIVFGDDAWPETVDAAEERFLTCIDRDGVSETLDDDTIFEVLKFVECSEAQDDALLARIRDEQVLANIAKGEEMIAESTAVAAAKRVSNPDLLEEIVRESNVDDVRVAAIERCTSLDLLVTLATDDDLDVVARAAAAERVAALVTERGVDGAISDQKLIEVARVATDDVRDALLATASDEYDLLAALGEEADDDAFTTAVLARCTNQLHVVERMERLERDGEEVPEPFTDRLAELVRADGVDTAFDTRNLVALCTTHAWDDDVRDAFFDQITDADALLEIVTHEDTNSNDRDAACARIDDQSVLAAYVAQCCCDGDNLSTAVSGRLETLIREHGVVAELREQTIVALLLQWACVDDVRDLLVDRVQSPRALRTIVGNEAAGDETVIAVIRRMREIVTLLGYAEDDGYGADVRTAVVERLAELLREQPAAFTTDAQLVRLALLSGSDGVVEDAGVLAAALDAVRSPAALARLAQDGETPSDVARGAVARISDRKLLGRIARTRSDDDVGVSAKSRLAILILSEAP